MSQSLGFSSVCRSQTRNNAILSIGYGAAIFLSIGFLPQTSMLPLSPIPHGTRFLEGHLMIYSRCPHYQLRHSQRQLAAGWTSRSCLVTAGKKFPWVVNMQCPMLHGMDKHMIQVFPFQMMSSVMFYMTSMKLAFTLTLFLSRILQTALTWILICAWSLSNPAFPPILVPKYQQSWDLQTVDCRHLLYNTAFCIFLQWGLWSWVGMPLLIGHSPLNCRSPNHLSSTQSQRLFDWRRLCNITQAFWDYFGCAMIVPHYRWFLTILHLFTFFYMSSYCVTFSGCLISFFYSTFLIIITPVKKKFKFDRKSRNWEV